jgi:hypothetical protein
MWAELRAAETDEGMTELRSTASSTPAGMIKKEYTLPGWIPLWREPGEGNYLGVDLEPDAKGVVGQVINFGRDEDEKRVLFWDYADAIAWLAEQAIAKQLVVGDQGLEHRDGRVLSALARFVDANGVPGKKPAAKPSTAKPKTAVAPKRGIEPEPVPTELPGKAQQALDQYIAKLRKVLEQHVGMQTQAYCNQELEPAERPEQASVGGDSLRMIPYEPAVDAKDGPSVNELRELAALSQQAGLTIQRIEIRFTKSKGWEHEVSIETIENRKRLCKARKPLDEEIATAIATLADTKGKWDRASLTFDGEAGTLSALVLPQREAIPISPAARAIFDRVVELHGRFRMRLRTASWSIQRAKPTNPYVRTYYG